MKPNFLGYVVVSEALVNVVAVKCTVVIHRRHGPVLYTRHHIASHIYSWGWRNMVKAMDNLDVLLFRPLASVHRI
jgi:hypothetical protein